VMFPAYSFRQFVRTRCTGTPNNVATPEREFHNVRQRVPPGQWPPPVNFGLSWSAIPYAAPRVPSSHVSAVNAGATHRHRLILGYGLYGHAKLAKRDRGLIFVILLNRE
jgi:hypothetical protein